MSKQYDSEGFMSTPLEGAGARPKDSYHPDSEDNRSTQPLHRFAITTTLMGKRRACAVNPVHTMSH